MQRFASWLVLALFASGVSAPAAHADGPGEAELLGRPQIRLDSLVFPARLEGAKEFEGHLRNTLRREARRANWGADSSSKIRYRFIVQQLELREESGVLHVSCRALGLLPKGKSAKSQLVFGGDPHERKKVIEHVLDIVARGVVTRLAELERARRTP